jgi:hypothetical protein
MNSDSAFFPDAVIRVYDEAVTLMNCDNAKTNAALI